MAQRFRDRLILDEQAGSWLGQTRRYMLIRPEALMGIFRGLPEAARAQAFAATLVFGRSVGARELQCVAMGAEQCRFEGRPLEGQT
jgi:hypothetical protein